MQTVDLEKVIQNLQIELQEYPTIVPEDDLMERFRKRVIPKLVQNVIEYLKKQPTIDAVEVIRCKDCVYQFTEQCPTWYEDRMTYRDMWKLCNDNDFCSLGERKPEDEGQNDC